MDSRCMAAQIEQVSRLRDTTTMILSKDRYLMLRIYRISLTSCISTGRFPWGCGRGIVVAKRLVLLSQVRTRKPLSYTVQLFKQWMTCQTSVKEVLLAYAYYGPWISTCGEINGMCIHKFCVIEPYHPSAATTSNEMIPLPIPHYSLAVVFRVSGYNFQ
ncbi:hypothetical protein AVEN_39584-1 [Araneus ventricosus]|nr:hypothetical protein AVEN_39584-1 [Araneus ventricosus]